MANDIREKVRKLLALAGAAGATDNERAVAMQRAQELIEKHNLSLGDLESSKDHIVIRDGERLSGDKKFHHLSAGAASALYECRSVLSPRAGTVQFFGMSHQVDAAEETYLWIVAQIESMYRDHLRVFGGTLSKQERAQLRAHFKEAAALRTWQRVVELMDKRKASRESRALVVVSNIAEKINDRLTELGITKKASSKIKTGFGTHAGREAGERVQLNRKVAS